MAVLPAGALAALGNQISAGLDQVAALSTVTRTRQTNGEYTVALTPAGTVEALLTDPSAEQAQIAAAAGVKATGILKVPQATVLRPGMRAVVSGADDRGPWTRTVEVTGVFPRRMHTFASVVDVALNQ